ncbi:hypothetical protein DFR48_111101 [Ciceribacter lividus]|uniref:Uncharacterized protein n=1 Tax=Ciceribacter lividus TaxID=1197950 RepID=A0A6I7HIW1_9HYPH|nr:hypothetical protein [Ciceribacter lividus]RCW21137.1 hypothetical protein DFR48_111101 [Ciceribacter lividus]
MRDMSVLCLGGGSVAWQAEYRGSSQSGYLEDGADVSPLDAFVVILTPLDGNTPRIAVESRDQSIRIDLYRVKEDAVSRLRSVMPLQARDLVLEEGERILAIPVKR